MNPQAPSLIIDGIIIPVSPHPEFEYTLTTAQVAHGYEVGESNIREMKRKHTDELIEGKHFSSVRNTDAGNLQRVTTIWTKRGIIRLGFFIKSERAKRFRDMAEDLCLREWDQSEGDLNTLILDELRTLRGEVAELRAQNLRIISALAEKESAATLHGIPLLPPPSQNPDTRDMGALIRWMATHVDRAVKFTELVAIAKSLNLFRGHIIGRDMGGCEFKCTPKARSTVGWIVYQHQDRVFDLSPEQGAAMRVTGTNRQKSYFVDLFPLIGLSQPH